MGGGAGWPVRSGLVPPHASQLASQRKTPAQPQEPAPAPAAGRKERQMMTSDPGGGTEHPGSPGDQPTPGLWPGAPRGGVPHHGRSCPAARSTACRSCSQ